jgi:hypothetical protein
LYSSRLALSTMPLWRLGDSANHLAIHHGWVDDAATIVGGDDTEDRHFASLHVDFDLYALHAKRAYRLVGGILATGAIPGSCVALCVR